MMNNLTKEKSKATEQRNRDLMVKFKNNNISEKELDELHKNLEKLIYKIIHENYVSEDFGDVVSKIWEKIIRYKHCYNENNGTYVTTWIATVARNVINTMRKKSMNYKAKNLLSDGAVVYNKKGYEMSSVDITAIEDETALNSFLFDFKDFIDIFEGNEKKIVCWLAEEDKSLLVLDNEKRKYERKKASFSFIKKKMGLSNKEFRECIKSIRRKCDEKRQRTENDSCAR